MCMYISFFGTDGSGWQLQRPLIVKGRSKTAKRTCQREVLVDLAGECAPPQPTATLPLNTSVCPLGTNVTALPPPPLDAIMERWLASLTMDNLEKGEREKGD